MPKNSTKKGWSYKDAGVNVDAGNELVERLKKKFPSIGGFAGTFPFPMKGYKKPLLVGCTDGVGTKLKVAQELGIHNTVGIDLVAMNVNDMICSGAKPLFFLDYYATGHLNVDVAHEVIEGVIKGCKESGCTLLGGETAEMPGMYKPDEYDLAGFAVGVVDAYNRVDNSSIKEGDVLLGLPSTGVHSNGFSLVRALFRGKDLEKWGKKLLAPTRIYVKPLLKALEKYPRAIKGMAHITGGGLVDNVPRMLPKKCDALFFNALWPVPEVFEEIRVRGSVSDQEMFRTFNMGLGMVLAVDRRWAGKVQKLLKPCYQVGRVEKGKRLVRFS